jgi:hypothetical protein
VASDEIDIKCLKNGIIAILDHLTEDLNIKQVRVPEEEDFYWSCPPSERYDTTKKPSEMWTGRLTDDVDLTKAIKRGSGGDISLNLIHLAPLLLYIGEKIQG